MRLTITRDVRYTYPAPATENHVELRVTPQTDERQTCLAFRLQVSPECRTAAYDLPTGRVHYFGVRQPHVELIIRAECEVETRVAPDGGVEQDPAAPVYSIGNKPCAEFLAPTRLTPTGADVDRVSRAAKDAAGLGAPAFVAALARLLHSALVRTQDDGGRHPNAASERPTSVAHRDFVHLMLSVCRRERIPARCVSGYLVRAAGDFEPEGHAVPGAAPPGPAYGRPISTWPDDGGGPTVSEHLWVETFLPDERWHGLDPVHGLQVDERFIKTHFGRDAADCFPVRALYRGPFAHDIRLTLRSTGL